MKCKECKRQIEDVLARGESAISHEITAHLEVCPECQEFHQHSRNVYCHIQGGMVAIANGQISANLLSRVRGAVQADVAPPTRRILDWGLAAVACLVMLTAGVLFIRNHQREPATTLQTQMRLSETPVTAVQPTPFPPKNWPGVRLVARRNAAAKAVVPSFEQEASSEVIVLPEEQQAFAKLVEEVSRKRELGVALTHPAPKNPELPVEIAWLQIESVQVKPLETEQGE